MCNDDVKGSFELNLEAMFKATLDFCVDNDGSGFTVRLTVCGQAKFYVQIKVDVWWLPDVDMKISIYETDNHCGDIFKMKL